MGKRLPFYGLLLALIICVLPVSGASAVDTATGYDLSLVDSIAVNQRPYFIALSPDGEKMYVSHTSPDTPDGRGSVSVIDARTRSILATIPMGPGYPGEIAITPNGKYAYLAVSKAAGPYTTVGADRVEVIDIETNRIASTIYADYGTIGVAITPDGKWAYVTSRFANTVSIIDTERNTVASKIILSNGRGPVGVGISPDGGRAYVVYRGSRNISVINTNTKTVVKTIPLSIGSLESMTAIAFTPDGTRAYVTFSYTSTVAVIDTDPASAVYNSQIGLIDTSGTSLTDIVITGDGKLAFVTDVTTNKMLIIDIVAGTEVNHVSLGAQPMDIALSKLPNAVAYVAVYEDNSIAVINYSNKTPVANAGPDQTVECAGPNGAAVVLDGTKSSDPDGDALNSTWTENGMVIAAGLNPAVTLAYGTHAITLTVDDGRGSKATDQVVITVADTTAPALNVTLSPNVLWPANHKYVGVKPSIAVSDSCSAIVAVERTSISSNEPDNGLGDGDMANDILIKDGNLMLRAERSGKGSGRVYTVAYKATDTAGNSTITTATVTVPHGHFPENFQTRKKRTSGAGR